MLQEILLLKSLSLQHDSISPSPLIPCGLPSPSLPLLLDVCSSICLLRGKCCQRFRPLPFASPPVYKMPSPYLRELLQADRFPYMQKGSQDVLEEMPLLHPFYGLQPFSSFHLQYGLRF